jgi:hypothetical protein
MHIYMEVPQGNSLCSYLKKAKISDFSSTKSENRRAEQVLFGEIGTGGSCEEMGK